MSYSECKNELLETGLFGDGEEAEDLVDDILEELASPALKNTDGTINRELASENFKSLIAEKRIDLKKRAQQQYLDSVAVQSNTKRFNSWFDEMSKVTSKTRDFLYKGQPMSVASMFRTAFFGNRTPFTLTGGKLSVQRDIEMFSSNYSNELVQGMREIEKKYDKKVFRLLGINENAWDNVATNYNDAFDKALVTERTNLYKDINRVMEGLEVEDPVAKDVGELLSNLHKRMATDMNKVGGKIFIRNNYNPHSHSIDKIAKVPQDEWAGDIRYKIDWEKTMNREYKLHQIENKALKRDLDFADSDKASEFLNHTYHNIIYGERSTFTNQSPTGFKPTPRATRKFERSRKIEFIDGEHYVEYATKYSDLNPFTSVLGKIREASVAYSTMKHFGSQPEVTLQRMLDIQKQRIKDSDLPIKLKKELNEELKGNNFAHGDGPIGEMYHSVTLKNENPANSTIAELGSKARNYQLLKLGSSIYQALFGDPISTSVQRRRVEGTTNPARIITTFLKRFDFRDLEVVESLGITGEETAKVLFGRTASQGTDQEVSGFMAKFVETFMRLTFLDKATDNARKVAQREHIGTLGKFSALPFDNLHDDAQHDLIQHNLQAPQWKVLRKATETGANGRRYMTPRAIGKLPDSDFEHLIPDKYKVDNKPQFDFENINAVVKKIDAELASRVRTKNRNISKRLKNLNGRIKEQNKKLELLEETHNTKYAENLADVELKYLKQDNRDADNIIKSKFKSNLNLWHRANEVSREITSLTDKINEGFTKTKFNIFNKNQVKRSEAISDFLKKQSSVDKKLRKQVYEVEKEVPLLTEKINKKIASAVQSFKLDSANAKKDASQSVSNKYFSKRQRYRNEIKRLKKELEVPDIKEKTKETLHKKWLEAVKNFAEYDTNASKVKARMESEISVIHNKIEEKYENLSREAQNRYTVEFDSKVKELRNKREDLYGKLTEDHQDKLSAIDRSFDEKYDTDLKKLHHETAVKFDSTKKELAKKRKALLSSVDEDTTIEIKNAKHLNYNRKIEEIEKLKHRSVTKFDADKKRQIAKLIDLREQRANRVHDYKNNVLGHIKEADKKRTIKNAKRIADAVKSEDNRVKQWDLDRERALMDARDTLRSDFQAYLITGDRYAVVQSDAYADHLTKKLAPRRGTIGGEIVRSAAQFKEQAVVTSLNMFAENRAGSSKGGINNVLPYLGFLGTSVFYGYATMTAKDLTAGRTPREVDRVDTLFDAAAYSGGLGFVWDVLLNGNRTSGNIFDLAGPFGGDVGEFVSAGYNAFDPDLTWEERARLFGKAGYKVGKNFIPNLWYLRAFYNVNFLYNPIEEFVDPGATLKREQQMMQSTGQEYIAR